MRKEAPGFWKFNCSLLSDANYVNGVNKLIEDQSAILNGLSAKTIWEHLKEKIKTFSINYSKSSSSEKRRRMGELNEIITEEENNYDVLNHEQFENLLAMKCELNDLIDEHTKKIIFHSRCKWYEDGEKNTKYFYSLEKAKYNAKTIHAVFDESGSLVKGNDVLQVQKVFYSKLYSRDESVQFNIGRLSENCLTDEQKSMGEEKLSKCEVGDAIKSLKNNRCPGPDGLPVDFYKVFWRQIATPLMNAIDECYSDAQLHRTASRGILNLIPKGKKDSRYLQNVRPITLLNTDYKVIEKSLVNRMMPHIEQIINSDQKGFIPGRKICTNIRKIFDLIAIAAKEDRPMLIFQADFAKAFDKVEMCAITGSLRFFNFPEYIIQWFEILYKDFYIRVQNNGMMSEKIHIQRSVHQGAPASATLFICIAEILANHVRADDNLVGIKINEIIHLLNQYADDTDATLDGKDGTSLNRMLYNLDHFKHLSGCSLNYEKTTVYRTGSLRNTDAKYYTQHEIQLGR